MLSDRKKTILRAVVEGYIDKAAPISSNAVKQSFAEACSSATIRNELSALESMGYLIQPHVSSGRIPSEKAFRFYVDELRELPNLSAEDFGVIRRYLDRRFSDKEDLLSAAKYLVEKYDCNCLILGCTELPLILDESDDFEIAGKHVMVIDPTASLARRVVAEAF